MNITVLAENTASRQDLGAEHGLSLYIEVGTRKILFDMGQSDLFLQNARILGIDIAQVDTAILSHGHYDHGGGIHAFLAENQNAPVYFSRYAFGKYYNAKQNYIGLDESLQTQQRLVTADDPMELGDSMTLLSCNARIGQNDPFGLTKWQQGRLVPDDFLHEQYLLVRENGKRILFTGCAHKGILQLMEWLNPDIVVGGFHFKSIPFDAAGYQKLDAYSKALRSYDCVYYTCHCTGIEQYRYLKKSIGSLHYLGAGDQLQI